MEVARSGGPVGQLALLTAILHAVAAGARPGGMTQGDGRAAAWKRNRMPRSRLEEGCRLGLRWGWVHLPPPPAPHAR